jgi:hypothetical protein
MISGLTDTLLSRIEKWLQSVSDQKTCNKETKRSINKIKEMPLYMAIHPNNITQTFRSTIIPKRMVPAPAMIMIIRTYPGRTYRVSMSSAMIRMPISQRTKRTSISKDPARNMNVMIIISQETMHPIIRGFFDIVMADYYQEYDRSVNSLHLLLCTVGFLFHISLSFERQSHFFR